MRKSIKLLVACMLCSPVAIVAQEQDSLFARKSKVAIEYGRGISFNLKESTTATAVASEEELSHKKSINNSNMLLWLDSRIASVAKIPVMPGMTLQH